MKTAPSRDFLDLEFEGADFEQTGILLFARAPYSSRIARPPATRGPGRRRTTDRWTLLLDDVVQGNGGPVRVFQKFTFEKHESMVRLVTLETDERLRHRSRPEHRRPGQVRARTALHAHRSLPRTRTPRLSVHAETLTRQLWQGSRRCPHPDSSPPRFRCSRSASRHGAQQVIPLWEQGAPGFESRRAEPEQHKDWWYKNIHNPSLTVFLPPAGKANGTAVIVAAGRRAS